MCMPVNSFSPSLVTNLMEQASMSPIGFKLSAVMLKNKKPIGPVLYNSDRMYSRGRVCSSLHAEANVLLNHFSSSLKYTGVSGVFYGKDQKV